ncbi:MAG: hypothetical protein GF411_00905 [Candidatus Lokiarchaeota archaeon]|nr:hypothetical protein [Candidatus Lokiarchaeota archaeon]
MQSPARRIEANWEEKCWGRVQHIFYNSKAGVSHLEVERGFRCSIHKHKYRNNMFCVHSGLLVVQVWPGDLADDKSELILLSPGEVLDVPAGYWHRFRVYRSGILTEIYTPNCGGVDFKDIERFDQGGEDTIEQLRFALDELAIE